MLSYLLCLIHKRDKLDQRKKNKQNTFVKNKPYKRNNQ